MRWLLLVIGFGSALRLSAQDKEHLFTETFNTVIIAFSKADSATLQKYIEPKTGIYYLEREGVYDRIFKEQSIAHYCRGVEQWKAYKTISTAALTYGKLPRYECSTENWTKVGSFVDTSQTDQVLTNTAYSLIKFAGERITTREFNQYMFVDSVSRRIVIATNKQQSLVFYLGYINNKWWITIIDCVSDDCSA